ncbi:unnamed protein product [Euphydryas editha]|uniref:Reverse transcriptase domain-containing protein n=1 Tax=Euphydryas editha TaxID=104508 RepID=A0AAU9UNP1_EUPED|nr:unnamed protein product [Euphydryas editha]
MAAGFHGIPIAPDSIEKTAFATPDGQFKYLRMPFGLCNAPSVYQRAINTALGDYKDNIALVYVDDILIISVTIEEGLQNLNLVLNRLTKAGFTLNISKCSFLKREVEYLGNVIKDGTVKPSPRKIQALVNSPVPKNAKELRQFNGLAELTRPWHTAIQELQLAINCTISKSTGKSSMEILFGKKCSPPAIKLVEIDSNEVIDDINALRSESKGVRNDTVSTSPPLLCLNLPPALANLDTTGCLVSGLESQCSPSIEPIDPMHILKVDLEVERKAALLPSDKPLSSTSVEKVKPINNWRNYTLKGARTQPNHQQDPERLLQKIIVLLITIYITLLAGCSFPDQWKEAIVVGTHKHGKPRNFTFYHVYDVYV